MLQQPYCLTRTTLKLDGMAIRVPTPTVSLLDFTFLTKRSFEISQLNEVLTEASKTNLRNVLEVNNIPLVSADFRANMASCIYDKTHTRKTDLATKVLAWYDNSGHSQFECWMSLCILKRIWHPQILLLQK